MRYLQQWSILSSHFLRVQISKPYCPSWGTQTYTRFIHYIDIQPVLSILGDLDIYKVYSLYRYPTRTVHPGGPRHIQGLFIIQISNPYCPSWGTQTYIRFIHYIDIQPVLSILGDLDKFKVYSLYRYPTRTVHPRDLGNL